MDINVTIETPQNIPIAVDNLVYVQPKLQEKTATPTTALQEVVADSGYDGLSEVTVEAIPTETANITENGTFYPTTGKFINEVTVNVVPQTEAVTAPLSMANGNQNITPSSGKLLTSVTVEKPSTLVETNIKKDINIGGVVGTLEASSAINGQYDLLVEATEAIAEGDTVRVQAGESGFALIDNNPAITEIIYSVVYNNAKTVCVTLGSSSNIFIYDCTTTPYAYLGTTNVKTSANSFSQLSFINNDTVLAVSYNGTAGVYFYDTSTIPYTRIQAGFSLNATASYGLAYNEVNKTLAVAGKNYFYVINTTDYTVSYKSAYEGSYYYLDVDYSPDGNYLVVTRKRTSAMLYDVSTGIPTTYSYLSSPVPADDGRRCYPKYNHGGTRLAIVGDNSTKFLYIYDTTTVPYTQISYLFTTMPTGTSSHSCAFSEDDKIFFIGGENTNSLYAMNMTTSPISEITTLNSGKYSYASAFKGNSQLCVGNSTPSNLGVFQITTANAIASKANNITTSNLNAKYGYSPNAINQNATGTVKILFN